MLNKHLLPLVTAVALLTITSTGYSQNVGIGQNAPASKVDVKGNLTVGASYSGTAAPANGAIIQGNVGIGTISPSALLTIGTSAPVTVDNSGNVKISSFSSGSIVMSGTGGLLQLVATPETNTYLQWDGTAYTWATAAASLANLTPGAGLNGSAYNGSTAQSWNVAYGSSLGTSVQGNTTLTVSPGIGMSGGGMITLGTGGTVTLNNTGVTSVGLDLPGIFTISGSPVTTTGTLTGALADETANTIFAGPASGIAAAPTFRALVADDLPLNSVSSAGIVAAGTGNANDVWATDGSGNPSWTTVSTTVSNAWGILGNSNTNSSSNFIGTVSGTTNPQLVFKINGTFSGELDNASNTYFGYASSSSGTGTGSNNTDIGYKAGGLGASNTSLGYEALNLNAGSTNIAIGYQALQSNAGSSNIAIGYQTQPSNSGSYNTIIGYQAGGSSSGSNNIALGYNALTSAGSGSDNIAIGSNANVNAGSDNTAMGSGSTVTSGLTYATAIGAGASVSSSSTVVLGSTSNVSLEFNGALMPNESGTYTAGTTGQILSSKGAGTEPTWGAITLSNATSVTGTLPVGNGGTGLTTLGGTNTVLFTPTANNISAITTANNGILVTSASGVPSIGSTLPAAVQSNITTVGTITSGTWTGTTIAIANGGTGQTTANAALNALLPSQTGKSGDALTTTGTNTGWTAVQAPITFSTTGTSGAATFSGNALNIPQYQPAGTYVTSLSVTANQGVTGSFTSGATPALTLHLGALTGVTSYNGLVVTPNTGVITSGTWDGTTIAIGNGGTGQTTANAALNALLPSQTGKSGDALTTTGTNTGWTAVQAPITFSTTGTSGAATFSGNALNIPQYQPAGSYLTGNQTITLSGDVSGSGATAITTTLATVNSNVGTFGDATHVAQITVNGKGLITAASSVAITGGSSSGWSLTGNGSTTPGTDYVGTTDGNALVFKTDAFEGMRLTNGGGSAAGNVVIGSGEASAAPVGGTLRAPSVVAGTSNKAGASLTITPGDGTGNGGSGNIIFQTALPGTSGTAINTMAEAMRIDSAGNVGVGGENPAAQLDVNGDLALRNKFITVPNGSNYALNPAGYSFIELSSTGSFNLTSISPGVNGKILFIWAPNAMDVTTGGSSNVKMYTGNPTNMITLIYSSSASEWIVTSSQ